MKRFFQILGICSILVFSFYYTDKIALIVQEKNPILQEIKSKENELLIDSKDATVVNNFIIPGIKGSKVNVEKSFNKMKSLNAFNEYYLVYDDVKPSISIEDNKDKIIIKNKQLDDVVELPNVGDNKLYLFIGDFVQDFMQKDSINIKDSDEQLILEKDISQESNYLSKQILYIDKKTKNPVKVEILNNEGEKKFIVNYTNFQSEH